jgi:hypothetical protein
LAIVTTWLHELRRTRPVFSLPNRHTTMWFDSRGLPKMSFAQLILPTVNYETANNMAGGCGGGPHHARVTLG